MEKHLTKLLKNLQIGQNDSTTASLTKREVEVSSYGNRVQCRSISLYCDKPVTLQQATIEATKIAEVFNMSNDFKVKVMAQVMFEDGWTQQRIKDAVKYVIKTNIYNTTEKGIEPGVILSFDKRVKLYTQEEVMGLNEGLGTGGFKLVNVPGLYHYVDGENGNTKTDLWYVRIDGQELPF